MKRKEILNELDNLENQMYDFRDFERTLHEIMAGDELDTVEKLEAMDTEELDKLANLLGEICDNARWIMELASECDDVVTAMLPEDA